MRVSLSLCYLFVLVSTIRMCVALVSSLELSLLSVSQALFFVSGLCLMFFVSGVLLFSKRS